MYLQSAIAGVMSIGGFYNVEQPLKGGVDNLVLRNETLRTVSGPDGSSTKEMFLCAVRVPGLS